MTICSNPTHMQQSTQLPKPQFYTANSSGGSIYCIVYACQGRHLRGLGGRRSPPHQGKRKKKKKKKERKKEKKKKREKKEKKRRKERKKERKKGTMNKVKLLHIKCCFFQFFISPVALKNTKNFGPPRKS